MKILKFLLIVVFAGSMIPTLAIPDRTPLWVRYLACFALACGCVLGAAGELKSLRASLKRRKSETPNDRMES